MNSLSSIKHRFGSLVIAVACLFFAGCGDRNLYFVSGKIVDMEGNRLPGIGGSTVEFDAVDGKSRAMGSVQDDGSFRMTTTHANDGAWVGKQRVQTTRAGGATVNPKPLVILC